jgi:hypothetical protein
MGMVPQGYVVNNFLTDTDAYRIPVFALRKFGFLSSKN